MSSLDTINVSQLLKSARRFIFIYISYGDIKNSQQIKVLAVQQVWVISET